MNLGARRAVRRGGGGLRAGVGAAGGARAQCDPARWGPGAGLRAGGARRLGLAGARHFRVENARSGPTRQMAGVGVL